MRSKLLDLLTTTRCARYVGKSASLSTKQLIPEPLPSSFPIIIMQPFSLLNVLFYITFNLVQDKMCSSSKHPHPSHGRSFKTNWNSQRSGCCGSNQKNFQEQGLGILQSNTIHSTPEDWSKMHPEVLLLSKNGICNIQYQRNLLGCTKTAQDLASI